MLCCELGVVKLSTIHTGVVKMVNMSVADVKNYILQYVNVKRLKILVRRCKIHHANVNCFKTYVNCLETLYLDVKKT